MHRFTLAFLLGVLLLQFFPHLPNAYWLVVILIGALLFRKSIYMLGMTLGFSWCLLVAHYHTSWQLPQDLEGKTISIKGEIASIPEESRFNTAFLFSLKKINDQSAHGLVRLTWHEKFHHLYVGDQWQYTSRLKQIHGTLNPDGFDYEAWAVQEGIRANGYITKSDDNKRLNHFFWHHPLDRMRQSLKEKIERYLPSSATSPWVIALALGERHGISEEKWEVLRNTGTNHLMAIAGLHIGFMAGFMFFLGSFVWRRIPFLALKLPAQHAGAISALIIALIYSAMAGFSIPTQRASIMLFTFFLALFLRRKLMAWHAWSMALLLVLLINPLSVLDASFWLSFSSVALIIYGVSARLSPRGLWWKLGRIQWVIALGLVPCSIGLFQQCSLISFIANSIAIPFVGFLIVPCCLLGCLVLLFSIKVGALILLFSDKMLSVLWMILSYFSHLSWASWFPAMPTYGMLITATIGVILLLLPIGSPGRWFGIVWLLPLCLYQPKTPLLGEMRFTLLDVGQGLSAVVQTKNHILIFDAGAKLGDNFDMGESVVVPFLHSLGAKKIDMLVVSHGDNDHIGGAAAIIQQFPVLSAKTSVPNDLSKIRATYCLRGERWVWDNVTFSFLYPSQDNLGLDNDSSCVLKISNGSQSILLTGDIEKFSEKYLIENNFSDLPATILVAPHHGSKTSAVDSFLEAVKPVIVLFPVGYRNRYHFPNPSVIEKYRDLGALQYDTAHAGAIEFLIPATQNTLVPKLYRQEHHHYWNLF